MKFPTTLLAAPVLLFLTACSSHYSAGHRHGYGHHSHGGHVSVGVHGGHHGRGGAVIGALIVGGVIGHLLTEAAQNEETGSTGQQPKGNTENAQDELVNGYPLKPQQKIKAELNEEQSQFYQLGEDGNCYLMKKVEQSVEVISAVPKYSCI